MKPAITIITAYAVSVNCVLANEPNGYPTYAPTVYETYSPTRYETYAPTPTKSEATYAPTRGDVSATDVPTDSDVAATTTAATTSAASTLATTSTVEETTTTVTTTTTTPAVPVCPNTLSKSVIIDEKATLHYSVVPSSPPNANNGILCGRLEAMNDNGWIGLGISTDGQMVGSEAIVGIPDDRTVLKYMLGSKAQNGVTVMPAEKQTLSDASISEDNGMSIMAFTKLLVENNEIPILENGMNTFLHARGANAFGYHYNGRLSFKINFSDGSTVGAGNAIQNSSAKEDSGLTFSAGNAQTMTDNPSNGSATAVTFTSLLMMLVLGVMVL